MSLIIAALWSAWDHTQERGRASVQLIEKKTAEVALSAACSVISAIAAVAQIYALAAYGNIVPFLIILGLAGSIVCLAIAAAVWLSRRNTPNEPNGSKRYWFNFSITTFSIFSALSLATVAFIFIYNSTTTSSAAPSEGQASPPTSSPGKTFGDKNCLPPSDPETSVPGLTVTAPTPGAHIGATVAGQGTSETVAGKAMLAPGEQVHIFLYGPGSCMFYLATRGPVKINSGEWHQMIYPDPESAGLFELYAVVVDADDGLRIQHVINDFRSRQENSPWVYRLPPGARSAHFTVICCK